MSWIKIQGVTETWRKITSFVK